MSVGMALAESFLNHSLKSINKKASSLIDHHTYVIASDGDMQEPITLGSASLAGHLKLSKLIVFYDANDAQISGKVGRSDSTNYEKVFEGFGWNVQKIDGHNHESIRQSIEKAKISEKFEEIVVPTHDVTEVKRGKRVQRKKKFFPGYVLIKSEMDNNIYHMIKGIKKVSGFLGSKGIPVPVSDKEIEKILGQIKDGVAQSKSTIDYSVGEKVQVVDGPFASFSGMIEDIDEEKSRVKVSVSIFGRPTPVDLEFNQIEKVS